MGILEREFSVSSHHLCVIPSCAVKKIRSEIPSEDGIYRGYIRGDDDDDDSDFDSDIQQVWRDFLNI